MNRILLSVCIMAAQAVCAAASATTFVVAKDGSGDFRTVQEAVNAVPDYLRDGGIDIYVKPGIYREKVIIPPTKERIHMYGDDALTTVISWDDYAARPGSTGAPMGTGATGTIYFMADDFLAENISFENTAGEVGQACAAVIDADRVAFRGCRFLGNQDTIYTYDDGQRIYFRSCYIEGTTDFIFGYGTAWFEGCDIVSKRDSYITAASTLQDREFGYVFFDCAFKHAEGVSRCYLGRPWRKYARTVLIGCYLGDHIRPEGWHDWGKDYAHKTAFYAEYGNLGPGAKGKRVAWARTLSAKEASAYTAARVLDAGAREDKNGDMIPIQWYYKVFDN